MYQILRVKKLKSKGNIRASLEHMFRGRPTFNADPNRRGRNIDFGDVDSGLNRFEKIEVDRQRKDAVQGLEYLITASPEFFAKSKKNGALYLNEALSYIEKKHGQGNVIAWSMHNDEQTPHLSIIVKPVYTNEKGQKVLSAKHFTGGREKLRHLQDDFHARVASPFSLGRGDKRSKAKHKDIQTWYSEKASEQARIDAKTADLQKVNEALELELKRLKSRFIDLETQLHDAKEEGGRWRKIAINISEKWFMEDIKKNVKDNNALIELSNEVHDSTVLPRGAKKKLIDLIDEHYHQNQLNGLRSRGH